MPDQVTRRAGNEWAKPTVRATANDATIRGRPTRTHLEITAMFAARFRRAAAAALAVGPMIAACSSGSTSLPTLTPTVAPTTLLTRLGNDTIAVEQYTRTATHMDGVLVSRSPSTRVSRYSVAIGPNGAPT